jgi:hypothetical protein
MTLKSRFTHLGIALLIALNAACGSNALAQSATEVGLNAAAIDKEISKKGASENKAENKSEAKTNPAEMAKMIEALEERVRQLEAKLAKMEVAPTTDVAAVGAAKTAAKADEVAEIKKEVVAIQEENKKNAGFLNFFRDVEMSGQVDGYYGYNFNHPDRNFNTGRNFDFNHNSFSLNYAEIVFEKKNDLKDRLGYRLDVGFGQTADFVHATDPVGGEVIKHIQQAYASYVAPVGKGLTVDFGKFVTPNGAEVIETKDNFNYSRSFLFTYAIPYYHAGFRAKYGFNDKVALTGFLVNGWNNVVDNNGGKTYGASLALTPTKRLAITQNYMGGPEQLNDSKHWRHLSDTVVTLLPSDKLTLMGNFDYGKDTLSSGRTGYWTGFAGYLRYAFTNKLAFAPRYEIFSDHDGFTTGLAQTLKSLTLTQEVKLSNKLLTRFEFRRDMSDANFFSKSFGRTVQNQNTLLIGFSYAFSTRE